MKKYTKDQILRTQISNMNLKTRLMLAKINKRPVKGRVYNSSRLVMAKQTPRKRKPGIIKLPAVLMAQLGFPLDAW